MSKVETSNVKNTDTLGDESFMSAKDLKKYMTEVMMTRASKEFGAMDKAEAARKELMETLGRELELTPEKLAEIKRNVTNKIKSAAERGDVEVMVMRFPNALCTDKGRAINNTESDWPKTLTGRPRQAFEFWKTHLQPMDYKLKAMIIDFPNGFPGDVGFFLSWA